MSSKDTELKVIAPEDKEDTSLLSVTPDESAKELQSRTRETTTPGPDDEEDDEEEDVDYHAETVLTIFKPVSITMLIVIWAVKTIQVPPQTSGGFMVYQESASDSTATRLFGSILNALVMLAAILVTTVLFVVLYKYRCMKIIYGWLITSSMMLLALFGGIFFLLLFEAYNLPLDWITFSIFLWNFAVVGILSIFWHAPTKVNQAYLIAISALMAIFFTRFPDWTTFAILAVIAIYDLFAVLCPRGPLRVLVETAQERKEPIPALLYNASVYMFMADQEQQPPPEEKRKGVKLGLGDFVFYSVLIGRAAMADMLTVFTCFIAIVTGLFLTLLLLAIFRKALPALPISIGLGILFYFLTTLTMVPYITNLSSQQIFI